MRLVQVGHHTFKLDDLIHVEELPDGERSAVAARADPERRGLVLKITIAPGERFELEGEDARALRDFLTQSTEVIKLTPSRPSGSASRVIKRRGPKFGLPPDTGSHLG